jgi:hypothetical protein
LLQYTSSGILDAVWPSEMGRSILCPHILLLLDHCNCHWRWDILSRVQRVHAITGKCYVMHAHSGAMCHVPQCSPFPLHLSLQSTLFPFGILVCVAGVYWLSQRAAGMPPKDVPGDDSESSVHSPLLPRDDDASSAGTDVELPLTHSASPAGRSGSIQNSPPMTGVPEPVVHSAVGAKVAFVGATGRAPSIPEHSHQHSQPPRRPPAGSMADSPPNTSMLPTASILLDRRHSMREDPMQGIMQLGMLMQPSSSMLPMHRETSEMLAHRDASGAPAPAAAQQQQQPQRQHRASRLHGQLSEQHPAHVADTTPLLQAARSHRATSSAQP